MLRFSRMIISDQKAVYHVMSRTALDGFPFDGVGKDRMVNLIRALSRLYFAEILGYMHHVQPLSPFGAHPAGDLLFR